MYSYYFSFVIKQGKELNKNGEMYIQRFPKLNVKLVDGSGLAVAIVLNKIPQGTTQVLLRGKLTKVACSIVSALCQRGIQVNIYTFLFFFEHTFSFLFFALIGNVVSKRAQTKLDQISCWVFNSLQALFCYSLSTNFPPLLCDQ